MWVLGDGVDHTVLEKVAKALNISLAKEKEALTSALDLPSKEVDNNVLVVGGDLTKKSEQILSFAPKIFIESSQYHLDFGLTPQLPSQRGYFFSFTTRFFYQTEVVFLITEFLQKRGITYYDEEGMSLVLQEVLSNAVLHGNLGIHSLDRSSMEGMIEMQNSINQKLSDQETADKRILVTFHKEDNDLLFSVRDQGKWIDHEKSQDNIYGRGSAIIRNNTSSFFIDKSSSTAAICFTNNPAGKVSTTPLKEEIESYHDDQEDNSSVFDDVDASNEKNAVDVYGHRILIVDDLAFNRQMILSILRAAGFTNMVFAEDGEQALEKVAEDNPALVILDLMMPKLDGYEVCKRLRQNNKTHSLPIIIQTALESAADRNQAFTVGATDIITKPINAKELVSRVVLHLQNRALLNELQFFKDRLSDELQGAILIQKSIFPSEEKIKTQEEKHNVDVEAYFQASSELTGDMWGFIDDDQDQLGLFVADFSGHGIPAAVNTFRLESIIKGLGKPKDPGKMLEKISERLKPILLPGHYATMWYGILDRHTETFRYASAGCTHPLVRLPDARIDIGDGSGFPLGVLSGATYPVKTLSCPKGAIILMYSDALNDNVAEGEENEIPILCEHLQSLSSPKEVIKKMRYLVSKSKVPVDDDLTLLAVKV